MSLKEDIEVKMKEAMKAGDAEALSLYRMLISAIKNAEIEAKGELDDNGVIAALERQAKQRRDSIEQYKSGGREDLAKKEEAELKIIEGFLPEKMGEAEVREIIRKKIAEMPDAQFGQVMGASMGELKSKADGALVQKIVKEEMGQ